jgi:stress-induced morphogen
MSSGLISSENVRQMMYLGTAPDDTSQTVERLEPLLRAAFPDAAELAVIDRTGTGDHFHVTVASSRFDGLSLVDQHKLIYEVLAEPLADGTIHELRITTRGT